jgi:RecJ-like exonuclease
VANALKITNIKMLVTTLLFGDDWVIIRADHLEIGRFELLKIVGEYNMEIPTAEVNHQ